MRSAPARRRPSTSADVARLAGVSRATVSHVLNGQDKRFPAETRERVRAAAAELGYIPSSAGRALVNGRGDTIVILLPDATFGTNLQDAIDRFVADTAPSGANVVVRFAGRDVTATTTSLLRLRPLAVIDMGGGLADGERESLEGSGVLILPRDVDTSAAEVVDLNDTIADLQVEALTGRTGPRQLYYASPLDDRADPFIPMRAKSLRRACRSRGLPEPRAVAIPLHLDGAVAAVRDLGRDAPLALACYNDLVALAVMAAARDLGRSIPHDVAVVGVDAIEPGQLWSPRLTTVRVDMHVFADRVVSELHDMIGNRPQTVLPAPSESPLVSLLTGESA